MAISFRSKEFQDTRNELLKLKEEGYLTKENYRDTISKFGLDPDEFNEADDKLEAAMAEGETDFTARGVGLTRIAGRLVGSTVQGVEDVFNAVAGTDVDFGEALPDSVREYASEIFDPYHGEGAYGTTEHLVGEIGSYFVPGTAAFKLGKGAISLGKAGKMGAGVRSNLINASRKAGRRGRKAGRVAGLGTAGAFGTTVIEDPRDNFFDALMEDEEGQTMLQRLEENPNDPTAMDYLEAFGKNLAIEVPASFAIGLPAYLAKAYKAKKAAQPKQKVSFLGKLGSNFSSRLGTDDKTLGSIIKRSGAAKKSIIEADGLAKDLQKTIKLELGSESPEVLEKVNNALQYSDEGLQNVMASFDNLVAKEARLIDKYNAATTPQQQKKIMKKIDDVRAEKTAVQNSINQLRRNKVDADELAQNAPETSALVNEMRRSVDDLSTYVEQNVVRGKLQARIGGNKGFYLNRSYDVFDDPKYAKELEKRFLNYKAGQRDEIIEGVEQYLRGQGIDADDIPKTIEALIPSTGDDTAKIFDFMSNRAIGTGAGTSKVLSKRGDIPDPIKALWGEVKDPYKNYVKTFEKLSVMKAEDQFLKSLANDLVAKGIASTEKNLAQSIDLGAIGRQRLDKILGRGKVDKNMANNPLENLYIDPVYARAIEEGLEQTSDLSGWAKTFMLAKGATQTAKTVYSPATHGRNLMGNIAMLAANGIVPGMKSSGIALRQTASRLAGKNNRELAEQAARYAELGITDSGIGVNLIRRNLNSILKGSSADEYLDKIALARGTKKTNTFLTNLYQAEDDMFKIIHFEKTKDYMRKAFPDKSIDEIEELAAQRTRDMMPNYALVPRFVKNLRGAPVGDFIAFPAEMIRTTKNLVKYTLNDLQSGNAELRKAAAKRLAGMTAVGMGGDALSEMSRNVNNISDKQEDAIDGLVPSYEQFQNRIYLSGINKDKRGNVGVNYINLGPLDPYAYLKTGAKAAHKMIFDGGLNDAELEGLAVGMLDNQIGPFMEPSMITKALFDLGNGKNYSDEPTLMGKLQKAAGIAIDPFKPGVLTFLEKRRQYEQTKADSTNFVSPLFGDFGEGKNLPEGVTPSSFTISGYDQAFGGDVGIPAFFGIRNQRLDLTAGMEYALNPALQKINNADRKFQRTIRDPSLYDQEDSDTIFNAYLDGQEGRLKGFQELKSLSDNYRSLFGDAFGTEIARGLLLRGKKNIDDTVWKNINLASSNYFAPSMPDYGVAIRRSRAPIPMDRIRQAYSALNGNKIEED